MCSTVRPRRCVFSPMTPVSAHRGCCIILGRPTAIIRSSSAIGSWRSCQEGCLIGMLRLVHRRRGSWNSSRMCSWGWRAGRPYEEMGSPSLVAQQPHNCRNTRIAGLHTLHSLPLPTLLPLARLLRPRRHCSPPSACSCISSPPARLPLCRWITASRTAGSSRRSRSGAPH